MKALFYEGKNDYPIFSHVELPSDGSIVKLSSAALNHRDLWILNDQYANLTPGSIMGADGCGYLDGNRVVIYPAIGWGHREDIFDSEFKVLGMPPNGTFAEYCQVDDDMIFEALPYLTDEENAALPLAFLTAYRALKVQGRCQDGDNVLISGIGGGVAIAVMQLALANGCNVFVTSSSEDKLSKAMHMGAQYGYNYTDEGWYKKCQKDSNGIDVVIDGAGGPNMKRFTQISNPGGRIVVYGGTAGNWENLSPQIVFWKQLCIIGSTMGSPLDFKNMLDFVANHKIHPIIDSIFEFEDFKAAFDRLRSGQQFGKIVLKINE